MTLDVIWQVWTLIFYINAAHQIYCQTKSNTQYSCGCPSHLQKRPWYIESNSYIIIWVRLLVHALIWVFLQLKDIWTFVKAWFITGVWSRILAHSSTFHTVCKLTWMEKGVITWGISIHGLHNRKLPCFLSYVQKKRDIGNFEVEVGVQNGLNWFRQNKVDNRCVFYSLDCCESHPTDEVVIIRSRLYQSLCL